MPNPEVAKGPRDKRCPRGKQRPSRDISALDTTLQEVMQADRRDECCHGSHGCVEIMRLHGVFQCWNPFHRMQQEVRWVCKEKSHRQAEHRLDVSTALVPPDGPSNRKQRRKAEV